MKGEADLSQLTDDELNELFVRASQSEAVLNALNEELKDRDSDLACELHPKVAYALRQLRASVPERPLATPLKTGDQARAWIDAFLALREIVAPDGRHLYRYRMTDAEYAEANRIVRELARSGRLARPDSGSASLFVAFCAEWFRRDAVSTWGRWNDLAPDIFPDVPYPSKQDLTERGLAYWRRPLRRSDSAREFLLSLALEGGIPVNAIVEGGRGWLKEYLRTIMQRAISHKTLLLADIEGIAGDESWRLRQSYRHDDFVALAAELAHRLLQWRKEAEEKAPAVDALLYLDGQHPGWRDDLPIYVPAGDTHARELISGLLKETLTGLATAGVGVRRFLVKTANGWKPAAQMLVDGEIPQASLLISGSLGNYRAVPTGELSNHISGDIALLEPPVGNQRTWRITPRRNLTRPLIGFPFDKPLTVSLTNPGASATVEWRGGQAIRSDLLVFEEELGGEAGQLMLRLVRAGSVSAPASRLFVLFPQGWRVTPVTEGAVFGEELIPGWARCLVTLSGAAYFDNPQEEGARFRVEPNTQAREAELEFLGTASRLESAGCDLWETPLWLKLKEGGRSRAPAGRELFWRVPGGKWTEIADKVDARGLLEISWRDPGANIQLEKRRIGLVPSGARIDGRMKDPQNGEITLQGLAGWNASTSDASVSIVQREQGRLSLRFAGRPCYRVPLLLQPPSGDPLDVMVPLTGREASVVLADGSIVQPGQQLDLGILRGALAVSPRRTALSAGLKGLKTAGMKLDVDGELPLSSLRGALAEMFAVSGSQDSQVELEFAGDHRPPIRLSRYRHDSLVQEKSGELRWHTTLGGGMAMPVARMLLKPQHEHILEQQPSQLWMVPEQCTGPCLIYLRDGNEVVSRPLILDAGGEISSQLSGLLHAVTIPVRNDRMEAMDQCLRSVGAGDSSDADVRWLLDLIVHLDGLPPAALDVLQRLPATPASLIQLLLSAPAEVERRMVWDLQGELPFLWLGLPVSAWASALRAHFESLMQTLASLDDKMRNEVLAGEALRKATLLTDLEPALASVLRPAGLPAPSRSEPPLRDLTEAYVRREHAFEDSHRGVASGTGLSSQIMRAGLKLPAEVLRLDHETFDGLLAPALLAAGALEQLKVDQELSLLIRRVYREDSGYVSGAFPHFLKFYGAA